MSRAVLIKSGQTTTSLIPTFLKLITFVHFWETDMKIVFLIVELKTSHCRELELGNMDKNKIINSPKYQ